MICLIGVCGGLFYVFRHHFGLKTLDDFELSRIEAAKKQKSLDPVNLPYMGDADSTAGLYSQDMELVRAMMIL